MISSAGHSQPELSDASEPDYRERIPNVYSVMVPQMRTICTPSTLRRRIHVLEWLPKYRARYLLSDVIAGVTVTLTAIPQSIAYGILANLTPQDGIYSNLVGCFMYFMFGSVKDVTVAPTSIMAIMIQGVVTKLGPGAALLTLMAGAITFLFGLLNLGFLVRFISVPVITGFTTAACLTIGSAQLRSLFGISSAGKGSDFIDAWENVIEHIGETRLWDAVLGFSSIAFLVILRLTKDCGQGRWKTLFKYLALLRNAMIVVIGASLAYGFSLNGVQPFKLTGHVEAGLPPFHVPPLSITNNGTYYSFSDMVSVMRTSIITIPLVSILEIISIGKAFSKDKIVDATQEMLALGMCNMAVAFFSPLPVAGSFTRTAINNSSGVKTSLGCAVTTAMLLLALAVLTDAFYYIPKATLASVVISAMIFMVDYRGMAEIWRVKKLDMVPFLGTVIACIFLGLDYGILIGIAINCCILLYLISVPKIEVHMALVEDVRVLTVQPAMDLTFSSAEYLRDRVIRAVVEAFENPIDLVVLDGSTVNFVDTTVVKNLASVENDLRSREVGLVLWRWSRNTAGGLVRLKDGFRVLLSDEADLRDAVHQWRASSEGYLKDASE
ncbi:sodium-independent sulfate anion transporter-like isoform X1 [Ochlerotatus camptorhynchus]|uniref:sodium-independent sulfate anion transporter-like isoform X1 n=2 Tax=Ochlerotatus camptorhynchus TaxID=644619 RepID=UPI0031D5A1AC